MSRLHIWAHALQSKQCTETFKGRTQASEFFILPGLPYWLHERRQSGLSYIRINIACSLSELGQYNAKARNKILAAIRYDDEDGGELHLQLIVYLIGHSDLFYPWLKHIIKNLFEVRLILLIEHHEIRRAYSKIIRVAHR